ncbi:MAG: FAD-dependent oxidoreductase [Nitrospira sp.]|nr:FAD-dependent oxidoreductase [Nitrospira sp.]
MDATETGSHLIIVVGAGPAGMQVANVLSQEGHTVVILNRDTKFGGLAEYGIFPSKHRLRNGLRKNYWEILKRDNVYYFGNITIGVDKPIKIQDLQRIGVSALVFATGAQGTKTIGVEGENANGVFHAKDVVYHYNQLPGFSERPFEIGQRVAVIGISDVMVDIAHWLIRYRKVQEVTAIVRRGPAERKYNPKEIRAICANINAETLKSEFDRIRPRLQEAGQDPEQIFKDMVDEFVKCESSISDTKMGFRFLASPVRVLSDKNNRVRTLELEENRLEQRGEDYASVGLKRTYEFPCDTVVFAVGDRVDQNLGLATKNGNFTTNPNPTQNEPDDALFQVYDDQTGRVMEGLFVAGWARKASIGLVGIAKRDGDWCSDVVQRYLAAKSPLDLASIQKKIKSLHSLLEERQSEIVNKMDIEVLAQIEADEAKLQGLEEFKFATNEEMLTAIQQRKRVMSTAKV